MFWNILGYSVMALTFVVGFTITAFIFCLLMDQLQRRRGE